MVALIEVTITSLMKSPLIEVIVTSPINEQMVGAIVDLRLISIAFRLVEKKDISYSLFFWLCSFLNLFYCTAKSFNYRNFS